MAIKNARLPSYFFRWRAGLPHFGFITHSGPTIPACPPLVGLAKILSRKIENPMPARLYSHYAFAFQSSNHQIIKSQN
ncbi:MAG: hypothetical protein ACYC09_12940 [Bacteroidota bacterium]